MCCGKSSTFYFFLDRASYLDIGILGGRLGWGSNFLISGRRVAGRGTWSEGWSEGGRWTDKKDRQDEA
jgi:hypothetical protein